MNISPNFTIKEIEESSKARKLGIDNTMPSVYFNNAQNLARFVLEPIRQHFSTPFSPTSWYRCKKLNEAVGGSKNSDHMIGAAADIAVPKVSLIALAEYIRDNLVFDQLILESYGSKGWIHVSFIKDNNKMEVLRSIENGVYLKGLI